jgi:hypothetical protein
MTNIQAGLLFSDKSADARARCKDVEWRVHRSILCVHNAYLAACLGGDFQPGRFIQETYGTIAKQNGRG